MSTEGGGNPKNDDPDDGGDSSPSPDDDYAATAAAAAATPTRPVAPRSSFYAAALAASSNLSEYAPFLPSDSSGASLGVGGGTDSNGDGNSSGGGGALPPVPASPVGRRAGSGVKVGGGGIGDVKLSPGSIVNEDRVKMVDLGGDEDGEGGKSLPVASFYPGDLTPRQVSEDPDVLMDALAAANRRRAEEQAGGAGVATAAATTTAGGDLIGDDATHPAASPGGVAVAVGAGSGGDDGDDGGPELDENLLMQYQIEAQCQAAVLCERNTGYNPMTARGGGSDEEENDDGDNDDNGPSSANASNGVSGGSRRRSSLPESPLVAPPPEVKLPELFGDLFRLELVRPTMPVPTKPTGAPIPPRPDGPELVVGTWIVSLREAREILEEGGDGDGDSDDAEGKEDDEDVKERWSVDRLPWVVRPGGQGGDDGDGTTGRPKDDGGGGADGERKEDTDDGEDGDGDGGRAAERPRRRNERFVLGTDERAARCLGCGGLLRVPGSASLATCPQCRTVSPAHWARTLEVESSSSGVR